MNLRKDRSLDELAEAGNVAQFVSFAPEHSSAIQTYSRVWQYPPNHRFSSPGEAIRALLAKSADHSINLRSFTPDSPRSREFLYGLAEPELALRHLNRLIGHGLFVIVNETINIHDSGVSGVIEGGVIEFAPDDTPRCVEKPGTASFALQDGLLLLRTVYGFEPDLPGLLDHRVEFSIHPKRRGYKQTHTLLWEHERVQTSDQNPTLSWPNKFSRLIGDKAFGLIIADLIGLRVPRSIVIGRRLRPFMFGQDTGSVETWLRTCPMEQDPGRYTTANEWVDPFALLAEEDPSSTMIASVISQASVHAAYSGAAIARKDGQLHIEGVAGVGSDFMLGRINAEQLPDYIICDLEQANLKLNERLGPVRFEWVHDGKLVWIVQLHLGATSSTSTIIMPGEAPEWVTFQSSAGLEALRELLEGLAPQVGLKLEGEIGLTSHLADLIRKSGRPTHIIPQRKVLPQQLLIDIEV